MIKLLSKTGRFDIYSGLAADTKPLPPVFPVAITSKFYEIDTGETFEYRGSPVGWIVTDFFSSLLRPTTGFTDGANCSGGGLTVINFSRLASFSSHAGVSFLNATTADTATVSSVTVTPDNQIEYTLTWGVAAPLINEEVRYLYDSGLGNYVDSDLVPMADQNIRITNCLDAVTGDNAEWSVGDNLEWATNDNAEWTL